MRWGHGDLWWLALVPVAAVALLVYGHLLRRHLVERAGRHALVQKLLATFSVERRLFKQLLFVLAISLVTAAAVRPQYGRRPEPLRQSGIDIAIAFDISKSMLVEDVAPSRIQAARAQLVQLLDVLKGDRAALVPFAGVAFTQSPLTADQSAIRLYLDSLDPMQMPVGGTNLEMAIKEGLRVLTGRGDRGERSSRSRVLLLITDGEDVALDAGKAAKEAARKAAEEGVKLYAVAVGTRSGDPVPQFDEEGNRAGYKKDSEGKTIFSKLNVELLEELCKLADPENPDATRVFQFDGTDAVGETLAAELDTLQKSALEANIRHKHGEKFQYALLPAILLLLGDVLVGERRRRAAS